MIKILKSLLYTFIALVSLIPFAGVISYLLNYQDDSFVICGFILLGITILIFIMLIHKIWSPIFCDRVLPPDYSQGGRTMGNVNNTSKSDTEDKPMD